ncbi:Katanin p80 WD40 repeat-containing subunit B1 [Linum grandiflorum]
MAASRFQAASLVGVPSYPNAIAWSDDNFIAVASGHIVTILNPALPCGPRGTITVSTGKHYSIGRVVKEGFSSPFFNPALVFSICSPETCFLLHYHGTEDHVLGQSLGLLLECLLTMGGCLLAVCTVEGYVKVYRPPYSDFSSNWIEVIDISDMLYDHLVKNNFTEIYISTPEIPTQNGRSKEGSLKRLEITRVSGYPNSIITKQYKRRKVIAATHMNINADSFGGQSSEPRPIEITNTRSTRHNILDCKKLSTTRLGKLGKRVLGSCTSQLLTSKDYAARSAQITSLVLAWSPLLDTSLVSSRDLSKRYSILAVGGKSGKISLWRVEAPQCYSVERSNATPGVTFLGVVQAHTSWITTVSLELIVSNSKPHIVMVTGSTDGSVKIWLGNVEQLLKLSKANKSPFSLVDEVLRVNFVPISALSVLVPSQSVHKMLIAVGKGSGSFEIWTCNTSGFKIEKAGCHDAHGYAITGLCWSSDGYSLYSCSQDNYVRSWVLCGKSFSEVPIPSNLPGQTGSDDVEFRGFLLQIPDALLSCLGVASSPGNLMVAMQGTLLNIISESSFLRLTAQKAVVEFFWIGGQPSESTPSNSTEFHQETFPEFPPNELASWEFNTLWSLKQYEDPNKPLVVWDITTALLGFKEPIPKYLDYILIKWLFTTFLGRYMDCPLCEIMRRVLNRLSEVSTRQLHLLNIIIRRVILSKLKAEEINSTASDDTAISVHDETLQFGFQTLFNSERELRERLVRLSFAAFSGSSGSNSDTTLSSQKPESWSPSGVMQMQQWVTLNHGNVKDQLNVLASQVQKHTRKATEKCTFCTASVPFESPKFATCSGSETVGGDLQRHEVPRCAASMQVCPATPLWFCKCCHRKVHKLAPDYLFKMPKFPMDLTSWTAESSPAQRSSRPLCPFCGILMQRLLPDFLLSSQPV